MQADVFSLGVILYELFLRKTLAAIVLELDDSPGSVEMFAYQVSHLISSTNKQTKFCLEKVCKLPWCWCLAYSNFRCLTTLQMNAKTSKIKYKYNSALALFLVCNLTLSQHHYQDLNHHCQVWPPRLESQCIGELTTEKDRYWLFPWAYISNNK